MRIGCIKKHDNENSFKCNSCQRYSHIKRVLTANEIDKCIKAETQMAYTSAKITEKIIHNISVNKQSILEFE